MSSTHIPFWHQTKAGQGVSKEISVQVALTMVDRGGGVLEQVYRRIK